MPFDVGFQEMIVVLVVAVVVFGGRLPEVARKVGSAVSEFRRGMREEFRKVDDAVRDDTVPPPGWKRPPDGDDCKGLGGPDPPAAKRSE